MAAADPRRLSVFECWTRAVAECGPTGDHERVKARYRELLSEFGHLLPGEPSALPCGYEP